MGLDGRRSLLHPFVAPGDATSAAAWDGAGGDAPVSPPAPPLPGSLWQQRSGGEGGGQAPPNVGISPQRVPGGSWRLGRGGGGTICPRGAHPGIPAPCRRDVPPPSPVPPSLGQAWERPHVGGETWGVVSPPPPSRGTRGARRPPQLHRRFSLLPSGIPLPKRFRRASDKEVGKKPEVFWRGGGGGEVSIRLSPQNEGGPPIPGAETGGRRVRIWHTTHVTALAGNPDAPALRVPAGERSPSASAAREEGGWGGPPGTQSSPFGGHFPPPAPEGLRHLLGRVPWCPADLLVDGGDGRFRRRARLRVIFRVTEALQQKLGGLLRHPPTPSAPQ